MNNPVITGTVHLIEPTKSFGQKGFRKRTLVVEQVNGKFTNYIPIEFLQDACDRVDELSVGDKVTVNYRLVGRKWQKDPQSEVKFFLSAEASGFQRLNAGSGIVAEPVSSDMGFDDDDSAPF